MDEEAARRPQDWLDRQVRAQLQKWPQRPPGLMHARSQTGTWMRGRPCYNSQGLQPFLRLAGSHRLRTLPDGLYLHFSPEPDDLWVDVLCIEACSSLANFLDKRSRFAPSTSSLLVEVPLPWLLAAPPERPYEPRWEGISCIAGRPRGPLVLPVRHLRVLFGLKQAHYEGFARNQVPQAHEYFCPMEVLVAEDGHTNPQLRALLARASAGANFMCMP